jgi:hypothetical protein
VQTNKADVVSGQCSPFLGWSLGFSNVPVENRPNEKRREDRRVGVSK